MRTARRADKRARGATVLCANVMGQAVGEPIALDRRRRRLSAVVKRYADRRRPYIVSVHKAGDVLRPEDHTVVAREIWSRTLVAHDDIILITHMPLGGGQTGKQIGAAVAMLALAFAAPYAVAGLGALGVSGLVEAGALTFAGKLAVLGITVGGAYAFSAATRAKASAPGDSAENLRPLYGVAGGGNLPRKGDRIPVGYGSFTTQPDLSQPDYFIYDGDDVILYKRVTLGLGKYDVQGIQVGAATLWTKADGVRPPFSSIASAAVSGQEREGGTGGEAPGATEVEIVPPGGISTLVPGSVFTSPLVAGVQLPRGSDNPAWAGPWPVCPVGRQTDLVQLDYQVPALLNGDYPETFAAIWQYAPCDDDDNPTGPWTTLHSNGAQFHSTQPTRFTRMIPVPMGRGLVRAQNLWPKGDNSVNEVIWDGLRAHFAETIVRPHVTEIALRIRSGKATGSVSFSDLWVKATRILRVWDSETSTWVEQPTRKAVWAYLDVLQSSYGGNLGDDRVDQERAKYYAATLTEFDTFDGVIRGPVSVYEAASVVLGPMRAEPAMIGAQWTIVRDEPRALRKHMFSRRQIKRGSTQAHFVFARNTGEADVLVEYCPDGDPRRRRDTRKTFGVQSLTPKRYRLEGVSDWRHARHLATWFAASAFYRREDRTVTADRQGRIVTRGDPVMIDAWFLTDVRAGGVMARSDRLLTLDTDMAVGADTYAELRDRRGRAWGPVKVTAPDPQYPNRIELDAGDLAAVEDFYDQPLSDVLAADSEDMTTVRVGTLAELQDPYLIQSVLPRARDAIEIKSVRDAPEVFDALGEALPPEPPLPSMVDLTPATYPVVPWVRARCVQKGLSLTMEWACGTARGAASYVVLLSYDDGDTYETASTGPQNSGSHTLRHVEGQEVKVIAYALDAAGVLGPPAEASFFTSRPIVADPDIIGGTREWITSEIRDELADIRRTLRDVSLSVANIGDTNWADKKNVRSDLVASEGRSNAEITAARDVAASATAAVAQDLLELTGEVHDVTTGLGSKASISNLNAVIAEVNDPTTGLATKASAATVSDLAGEVHNPTTGLGAKASISNLNAVIAEIDDPVTGLATKASAATVSDLAGEVHNPTTGLGSKASISNLNAVIAEVNDPTTGLATKASAATVSDLAAEIHHPTTGLGSKASISNLNAVIAEVNDPTTGLATKAAASTVTMLSTTVSGHTSTLTTYGTSINGLLLEYGVAGTIDGVSGHFIFGGVKKNDGSVTYTVDIDGNLIVHGTLITDHLVVGAVSAKAAATAADGNATINWAAGGSVLTFSGSQTITAVSVPFTSTTGNADVDVGLSTQFAFATNNYPTDGGFFFYIDLVIDGTTIKTWRVWYTGGDSYSGVYFYNLQVTKRWSVSGLSAGSHTAYMKVRLPANVQATIGAVSITVPINDRAITVTELKR